MSKFEKVEERDNILDRERDEWVRFTEKRITLCVNSPPPPRSYPSVKSKPPNSGQKGGELNVSHHNMLSGASSWQC